MEFGRYAAENRQQRGERKPATFDFLGFTHYCSTTRQGWFTIKRSTVQKRMRRKIADLKVELRRRLHAAVPDVGRWLGRVVRGHYNYYAVPFNSRCLAQFRHAVIGVWFRTLRRRSQRTTVTWQRMHRLAALWIPTPRIQHPHPRQRLRV